MEPSPTPPRRFSRWKTTKRTFTFGDVANHTKPKLQKLSSVQEQSQNKVPEHEEIPDVPNLISCEPLKPKNKLRKKLALHDLQLGPNIKVAGDPTRDQLTTNEVGHPLDETTTAINRDGVEGELQLSANETSYVDNIIATVNEGQRSLSASLQQKSSLDQASKKLSLRRKNMGRNTADVTVEDLGHGDPSAHHLTHNSSTLKGVIVEEAKRKHRHLADLDREDSTESSSTDKENKGDKIEVSLVRQKKTNEFIGSLQQHAVADENVLNSAKRNQSKAPKPTDHDRSSSLRNRDLLTPAETLRKERQYPHPPAQGRKASISLKKDVSGSKASITLKKDVSGSKEMSEDDSRSRRTQMTQQKKQRPKVDKKTKENLSKVAGKRSSQNSFSMPNNITVQPAQDSQITSRSRNLRDRSLMLSPASVQKMKQYPMSFFYSKKKFLEVSGSVSPDENTNRSKQKGRSPTPKTSSDKSKQKKSETKMGAQFSRNNVSRDQQNAEETEPDLPLPPGSFKKGAQKLGLRKSLTISKGQKSSISNSVLVSGASSGKKDCSDIQQSQSEEQLELRDRHLSTSKHKVPTETKVKQQKSKVVATDRKAQLPAHQDAHHAGDFPSSSSSPDEDSELVVEEMQYSVEIGKSKGQTDESPLKKKKPSSVQSGFSVGKQKLSRIQSSPSREKNKSSVSQSRSSLEKKKSTVIQSRSPTGGKKSSGIRSGSPMKRKISSAIQRSSPLRNKKSTGIMNKLPMAKNWVHNLQNLEQLKTSVSLNNVSINETILSSQKTQRKRNLVTELATIDEEVTNGPGMKIKLWCPGNHSRPGSDATAFDVILEEMETLEDNLRSAQEDESQKKLIGRVMRGLKKSIREMIFKVLEVKALERDVKKKKFINKNLLTDLTELEKQKRKLRGELQAMTKDNPHKNLMLANQWMNDFRQLLTTFSQSEDS